MALDPRIILAAQPVDVIGSMSRGNQLAAETNTLRDQNALRQVYQTQGQGLLQGNQSSLNALAAIDPAQAMGLQNSFQETQTRIQVMNAQEKRAAQEFAARASAEEKAAAIEATKRQVFRFLSAPTPEVFDQLVTEAGKPELRGMFNQRQVLAADYVSSVEDALKLAQGEPASDNQTERDIALLGEIGIPRQEAIRITQLYVVSRDPMTGEQVLIDKSTGRPIDPAQVLGQAAQPTQQPSPQNVQQPVSMGDAGQQFSFGEQYQNAPSVFGWEGLLKRGANAVSDVIPGIATAFPEEQQTLADFRVLGEQLVNDIASAYPRQPPSWLLENIAALTPKPGTVWEGADSAAAKLRSLGASMQSELRLADQQLGSRIAPAQRQEILLRKAGIESALNRIQNALSSLEPQAAPSANVPQEDIDLMNQLLGGN